jgi:hypothetical protein
VPAAGHADHQAAVVAPVGRPPGLAVGHQRGQVLLERGDVELPDFLAVVEAGQRIGLAVVLVQDVEVEGFGPPVHLRHACRGDAAMHDGALASRTCLIVFHRCLLGLIAGSKASCAPQAVALANIHAMSAWITIATNVGLR